MQNVEPAFAGLNSNTGTLLKQMMQQFARGSALSGFNTGAAQLAAPTRLFVNLLPVHSREGG